MKLKAMWVCPICNQRFVNKNQWHSCAQNTLENFLDRKYVEMTGLFNHFVKEYKEIGMFELHPAKTRIAFVAKIRFCGINKIGSDFIQGTFIFIKPYNSSIFYKIENVPTTDYYIHHFRLTSKKDINSEFKKYMRLAYAIGERKHLEERKK